MYFACFPRYLILMVDICKNIWNGYYDTRARLYDALFLSYLYCYIMIGIWLSVLLRSYVVSGAACRSPPIPFSFSSMGDSSLGDPWAWKPFPFPFPFFCECECGPTSGPP